MYDVSVGTREQHPSSRILSSEQHCTMGMDVENSDHCTVDNVVVPSCENKLWYYFVVNWLYEAIAVIILNWEKLHVVFSYF